MGNSPEICRKHYAALIPEEMRDTFEFGPKTTGSLKSDAEARTMYPTPLLREAKEWILWPLYVAVHRCDTDGEHTKSTRNQTGNTMMRKYSDRTWVHFAVMVAVCLVVCGCGVEYSIYGVEYSIYVVDPVINNRPVVPDAPLPPTCQPGQRLRITVCRGEYEPVSFVIETQQPLQSVDVQVSRLRGREGEIGAVAVDVRVVAPVYRRITDFPAAVHWLLLHDPNLVSMVDRPAEEMPKADAAASTRAYVKKMIFNRRPVDTATLQPADVQSRQQFWLTVHVPDDANAGTYTGDITILAENAAPRTLRLELTVPDFDLEPAQTEFSVYHPAWIEGGGIAMDNPQRYTVLTEQQYLSDLKNMVAHGCLNPTIYTGPGTTPEGDLDFTAFARVLDLRDQAGIPRHLPLYVPGAGRVNSSQQVTPEQKRENTRLTRQFVDWLDQRGGYGDLYLMGADEATGDALMAQRDAWESVRAGGAKIFVAHFAGYTEGIGHLLDLPIMLHPMHPQLDKLNLMPGDQFLQFPEQVRKAVDLNSVFAPEVQKKIQRVHEQGYRLFTYMDPLAGYTLPEVHRRMRGLVMWKSGLDGTMTWSYAHLANSMYTEAGPFGFNLFNFVLRGAEASMDSLSWEAYREGYDDSRYLATLLASLETARSDVNDPLVNETDQWLDDLDVVHGDLDAIRLEMVQRITALRALRR